MDDGEVGTLPRKSLHLTTGLVSVLLFGAACATTTSFVYTPTGTPLQIGEGLAVQIGTVENNLKLGDPAKIRYNLTLDRPLADAVREALIGELRQAGFSIGASDLTVALVIEAKDSDEGLLGDETYWTFRIHRAPDGRPVFSKRYTQRRGNLIFWIWDARGQIAYIQQALLQFVNDPQMLAALKDPVVTATRREETKRRPPPAPTASHAAGSGFLVRDTNLVLTNYHVVRDRNEIRLIFPNGEEYSGRVVERDRSNDLALVEAMGRPMTGGGVSLAVGAEIKEGQQVYALGYPLGSGLSRRPSIVGGLVSSTVGLEDDVARFRTTAPINPGSSGGPIVDEWGRVIGIAAAGLVRAEVEAIRFGIKAATAALILQHARVAQSFDIKVASGSQRLTPEEIFREVAPHVVLIEAR